MNLRTDLAVEAREMYIAKNPCFPEIDIKTKRKDNVIITKVNISKDEGEKIKKAPGNYVTLESENFKSVIPEFSKRASYILKEELEALAGKNFKNVLVVGLGNRNITPDSLGPKVISKIMVTRHIKEYMPEHIDNDIIPVSAISPGVLGITGIETNDIISGVIEKIKPDLIIVIDALAATSPKRICTTLQLTDTGINPGSGVGNNRKEISRNSLGIPVIAIGVPTVVDLLSIVYEMSKKKEGIKEGADFFVTPKEIDKLIENMAVIIANGINLSLHKNIDLDYIEAFIS